MPTNPNDTAFPAQVFFDDQLIECSDGLTKREYFAGLIYAQLIHISAYGSIKGKKILPFSDLALDAVSAADALMVALSKEDS